ncbi:MAG TPA: SufD family Fe-S cluster assembly protein [Candidatus Azoamicus sp.]
MYPNLNLNYFTSELLSENKIFIKIPKNLNFKNSINIININKKELNNKNQKIYLIIEENSKIDILNYFIVKNKNLSNNININIFLKKNSFLNYKIINSNKKINNTNASIYVKQLKDSNLKFTEMAIGKTNLNSNKFFFLLGKNSDLNKKAGYILNSKIKCNILCKINHYENDSKSKILIKATTNEHSEFKFKGNIEVSINTEKTQSNLTCKGVMLEKKGSIELTPELSINNNNIICSHAATIGYIDKNIITYMKSRGISEKECINTLKKIFFLNSAQLFKKYCKRK